MLHKWKTNQPQQQHICLHVHQNQKIIKENYAKIVITEIYLYTGAEAQLRETQSKEIQIFQLLLQFSERLKKFKLINS